MYEKACRTSGLLKKFTSSIIPRLRGCGVGAGIEERIPKVYTPDFCIDECRHHGTRPILTLLTGSERMTARVRID